MFEQRIFCTCLCIHFFISSLFVARVGKSTTLRLISRIFDASVGSVRVDGVDVSKVSLQSLRRRISVVPQDTSLFDETVEYNIRYGKMHATSDELSSVLEKCNLLPVIAKLKQGLQTPVGERGEE